MDFILITLKHSRNSIVDMKIPAFMAVGEFIEIICRLYDILASTLQAEPLGIVLDKRLTFAQQQVENGAMLTLYS